LSSFWIAIPTESSVVEKVYPARLGRRLTGKLRKCHGHQQALRTPIRSTDLKTKGDLPFADGCRSHAMTKSSCYGHCDNKSSRY